MSVSRKLVAGFAGVALVFTGLALYQLALIQESAATSRELRQLSGRLEATSSRHLRLLDRLEESASKYWVTRDDGYAFTYAAARDSFGAIVGQLEEATLTDQERAPMARLVSAWAGGEALPERLPGRLSELAAGSASDSLRALRSRVGTLREQTLAVNRAAREAIGSRVAGMAEAENRAATVSWIALAGGLLVAGLVSWLVIRSLLTGLGRLRAGTREVAEGDFEHRIQTQTDDEFAELAEAFNAMTERLDEVDRLKRDFLSQVSHDLKTPLASIRETTRLLLDEVPGPLEEDQRRLLEMSLRSGERLSSMIEQLLELSRMEADAVEYELEPADLGELVEEVAEEFRPRLRERSLALEVGRGEDGGDGRGDAGPVAAVDPDRVVQVLQNLLENARKHSPEGGTIRVWCDRRSQLPAEIPDWAPRPGPDGRPEEPGWALISVADDGPGVPPEARPRIFERFRQVERQANRSAEGVGLGLTLCREIVRAHDGTIWVEESDSGGSRFRVLLPAEPRGGEESREPGREPEGARA